MLSEKLVAMSEDAVTVESHFLRFAEAKIRQQTQRILQTIPVLPDEVFWHAPNDASNSVAQLLLHLAGNVRQWILHGVGGEVDRRDRDAEFAADETGPKSRHQVEAEFSKTVEEALVLLSELPEIRLAETIRPQGYTLSVLEAIFHVTEHFSYHAGQVFLLVKLHSQTNLDFYRHLDKSNKTHNEHIP